MVSATPVEVIQYRRSPLSSFPAAGGLAIENPKRICLEPSFTINAKVRKLPAKKIFESLAI
jgi:hypothetical protein